MRTYKYKNVKLIIGFYEFITIWQVFHQINIFQPTCLEVCNIITKSLLSKTRIQNLNQLWLVVSLQSNEIYYT